MGVIQKAGGGSKMFKTKALQVGLASVLMATGVFAVAPDKGVEQASAVKYYPNLVHPGDYKSDSTYKITYRSMSKTTESGYITRNKKNYGYGGAYKRTSVDFGTQAVTIGNGVLYQSSKSGNPKLTGTFKNMRVTNGNKMQVVAGKIYNNTMSYTGAFTLTERSKSTGKILSVTSIKVSKGYIINYTKS